MYSATQETILQLWELDIRPIDAGAGVFRWHNEGPDVLQWRGLDWTPFKIEGAGFSKSIAGRVPEPTVRAGNALGVMSNLMGRYRGLAGSSVVRYEIWESNLDGRPGANPNEILAIDRWNVARDSDNAILAEITLVNPLVLENVQLPRRRMVDLLDY